MCPSVGRIIDDRSRSNHFIKAVAKGPILRPWPDQFWAKKKKKGFKTKIIPATIEALSRLRSVKISQLQVMGKCEIFKSFRGSAPDPGGGAYSAPQTPSWRRAVLCTACLASQDLPSFFFSHSSNFGRTSFFFVATALFMLF